MEYGRAFAVLVIALSTAGCSGEAPEPTATTTAPATTTPSTGQGSETVGTSETGTSAGPSTTLSTTSEGSSSSTGVPAEPDLCVFTCAVNEDCDVDGGTGLGYFCIDGACTIPVCTADIDCQVKGDSFLGQCASHEDCGFGVACTKVFGGGYCAIGPSMFLSCEDLERVELEVTGIDDLPVTVCGELGWGCDQGLCRRSCESPADCGVPTPSCNLETGLCECARDSDCALYVPGTSSCVDGRCQCSVDADCDEVAGDVCAAGVCGCSGDRACDTPNFDGAAGECVSSG